MNRSRFNRFLVVLLGICEASRFDSIRKSWAVSSRLCLPIAQYRLASSTSDHTPVLFNVFEDWNEESVVPHISFDSIRFERKRPIRRSLHSTSFILFHSISQWLDDELEIPELLYGFFLCFSFFLVFSYRFSFCFSFSFFCLRSLISPITVCFLIFYFSLF